MKIKQIVKNVLLSALLVVCSGCKKNVEEWRVAKVTDLTGEEEVVSDIVYDNDGRVVQYGETPITYEGDKVVIGEMNCAKTESKLCSVTFKMVKGKAKESKTHCVFKLGADTCEANKTTIYEYGADTICVQSDYRAVADNRFLREVCGKYVFDGTGKLKEVITTTREANDSTSTCYTYYNYDSHIGYQANLNIQAYVVNRDGLDSFFYFLLNLGDFRKNTLLPNDIGYCVSHGSNTYNVHANYRLDNESPTGIEVLYDYTKLLSRFELSYKNLK